MTFDVSQREVMLRALERVLQGIPGVQHVSRQAVTSTMLAASQLPAILVDEQRTTYTWASARQAPRRSMRVSSAIALDLQVQTRRGRGHDVSESTVREAFVDEVIQTLVNNPELVCRLDGEDEDQAHCRDAFAATPQVRYVPCSGEFARAIIVIRVDLEAVYERRDMLEPNNLLVELAAHDAAGLNEYVDELVVDVTE